jgi:quercetin dioxygenase-like cupin family protein
MITISLSTMTSRHLSQLAGLLILLAACSSTLQPSLNPEALASGAVIKALAGGQLSSLPTGPVYIRVIHFAQPAGHTIQSRQHVAGFVYVEKGRHLLLVEGRPQQDIGEGEATFLGSVTHRHFNPGPDPNSWYFMALWPNSARAAPLVDPAVANVVFATADLGPAIFSQGMYSQVLRKVTLGAGGRTSAHMFGGFSVLYVLDGSLTVRASGAQPATLVTGEGVNHQPGTRLQELNPSGGTTTFVELLTTAAGKDFETVLSQPPDG